MRLGLLTVNIVFRLLVCDAQGRGKKRALSGLNTRNMMTTKNNFIEKDKHTNPIGSKPHS